MPHYATSIHQPTIHQQPTNQPLRLAEGDGAEGTAREAAGEPQPRSKDAMMPRNNPYGITVSTYRKLP